ncbi:MAG: hypothetical protein KAQ94_02155 [Arcobacteraceae bacterium]|nr:hypothetical protein [Arcobacteraceae bacterium]
MKFNKQIIIVLVLSSLLLSALGAAFYFYKQNKKALVDNDQLRIVYVAAKDIKKNIKIEKKHLKQVQIAKKYVLTTPLLEKEIIGKFTKENIYTNDIFRKEKLVKELLIKKETPSVIDNYKFNSYNIAFRLFKNPNYSLKKGDTINIISVYPATLVKGNGSPNSVQYVANKIKIIGFLRDGKETDKTIKKVKITRTVKKKTVTEEVEIKAQELILDIDNKVLLSLTDDYNRGAQLWMVKTKKLEAKTKKKVIQKSSSKKIKRNYPIKLYKPRDSYNNLKATIHYADQKDAALTKSKTIKIDASKLCQNNNLFLLGISNKVHLRTGPTIRNKIARIVYRNYIIPQNGKVNKKWYKTCDGYYVHTLEVKEISKKFALKKLGK